MKTITLPNARVAFDADDNAHYLAAGTPVLAYPTTLRQTRSGAIMPTTEIVAVIGDGLRRLMTYGRVDVTVRA